jgi:hypothetical protein
MGTITKIGAALCALMLTAPLAQAKIYASAKNTAQTEIPAGGTVTLPLNSAGRQSVGFILPATTTLAITFSGVCDNAGPTGGYTSAILLIDGIQYPFMSQTNNKWCGGPDYWIMTSATVAVRLAKGAHNIGVQGQATGVRGSFSTTSLVVFD